MGAEEEVVEVSDTGSRRGDNDGADKQKGAKKRSAQKFKGLGSLLKKIESK